MPANNIKLLSKEDLAYFNRHYQFSIENDEIVVRIADSRRKSVRKKESFSINAKYVRKITFTDKTIEIWEQLQKDDKFNSYTLVDIQQTVNILRLSYQVVNLDNVKEILKKDSLKIRKI